LLKNGVIFAVVIMHIFKGIWCNLSNVLYSMVSIEFACHFDVNLLSRDRVSILGQPCCSWWTNHGSQLKCTKIYSIEIY
jgi:hypothetical protein